MIYEFVIMIAKKQIENVLKTIPDPELGISVWDLGLIYNIDIDDKKKSVNIRMTLTSIGCPLFSLISDPVRSAILEIKGVKDVNIDLTFEPPWSVEKMSRDARIQLGMD
jgi:metal-sulfur cluster biosynthetic enzyme